METRDFSQPISQTIFNADKSSVNTILEAFVFSICLHATVLKAQWEVCFLSFQKKIYVLSFTFSLICYIFRRVGLFFVMQSFASDPLWRSKQHWLQILEIFYSLRACYSVTVTVFFILLRPNSGGLFEKIITAS
jgi:hypothetical protein